MEEYDCSIHHSRQLSLSDSLLSLFLFTGLTYSKRLTLFDGKGTQKVFILRTKML